MRGEGGAGLVIGGCGEVFCAFDGPEAGEMIPNFFAR